MFFWLTSLLTGLVFVGILAYLAFLNETLDAFFKVSLLFTLYFAVQLLPYVTEIKEKAPTIFNILVAIIASYLYLVIPPLLMDYYKHFISMIGPLYIIVEAAQSVGISIIIGEKVADWLSGVTDDFTANTVFDEDRERYGCKCRFREQFALGAVICIYALSFWVLYKAFMVESIVNWPITPQWVFGWTLIAMTLILVAAIQVSHGTVVQTALISLFLSYIIYCASQLPSSMDTVKQTDMNGNDSHIASNSAHFLLQSSVVLVVLLSIPPTMEDLDQIEINKLKYETGIEDEQIAKQGIKTVFGKSTRLQSFVMAVLVLLVTHVFQLWTHYEALSVNLFAYRMMEAVVSVLLYLFFMWREQDIDYEEKVI